MSEYLVVQNIEQVLTAKLLPLVTVWNRLEGRPRTTDFSRALEARIRDPLWMISKQWQMGEFEGDDAGSPVSAKLRMTSNRLNKYQADENDAQVFQYNVPLEAKVEQRPVRLSTAEGKMAMDLRLMLGCRWMKMIASFPASVRDQYLANYSFTIPDPTLKTDDTRAAHSDVWQKLAACADRSMDGGALIEHLRENDTNTAADGITGLSAAEATDLADAGKRLLRWFRELFYQPHEDDNQAWLPNHLEYQFSCSTPAPDGAGEKVLIAEEYYHGRLDWYNLDVDPSRDDLGAVPDADPPPEPKKTTVSFLPTPMIFNGMPNTRWWEFEDSKTNFAFVDPSTTDIAKLLVVEFGLVYANDWFLVPLTLPVGSVAQVDGLAVTNVFGERAWIEAAGRGADDDWQRWNMYGISVAGNDDAAADNSLLLLPTVAKIQESEPLEEVAFVRDEMANMVWGIETKVPLMSGITRPGAEAATEIRRFHRRLVEQAAASATPAPELENDARIRYKIMRSPSEQWIPFIPVHIEGSNREVQLQRAALPRVIEGDPDPPVPIRPRTFLLREGRDVTPVTNYFIHEEEITRAGTHVLQTYQRTRWSHGEVFTWIGVRKHTGRGEAYSSLAFDQIVPKKSARATGP